MCFMCIYVKEETFKCVCATSDLLWVPSRLVLTDKHPPPKNSKIKQSSRTKTEIFTN